MPEPADDGARLQHFAHSGACCAPSPRSGPAFDRPSGPRTLLARIRHARSAESRGSIIGVDGPCEHEDRAEPATAAIVFEPGETIDGRYRVAASRLTVA